MTPNFPQKSLQAGLEPPVLKAWLAQAGLNKALLSRAHSEGPGNVFASGGASAAQSHDLLLNREPDDEAGEEKSLDALLLGQPRSILGSHREEHT